MKTTNYLVKFECKQTGLPQYLKWVKPTNYRMSYAGEMVLAVGAEEGIEAVRAIAENLLAVTMPGEAKIVSVSKTRRRLA